MNLLLFSDVKDECLRINRPANNVLELIFRNCHDHAENRTSMFLTKSKSLSSCPVSIGHLLLESNYNHHRSLILRKRIFQMSVGCDRKEKLMIYQREKGLTRIF